MVLPKALRFAAIVSVLTAGAVLELGASDAHSQTVLIPAYETVYVPTTRAQLRYERRAGIHEAFLKLGVCVIALRHVISLC